MKYEIKKLEAFGRFSASRVVASAGLSMICDTTAAAPDAKVVTRNTWTTWKAIYHPWVLSSTAGTVTSPLSFATTSLISINRLTIGKITYIGR